MRRPLVDYSVYLVTDRTLCGGRDLLDVVAEAVQGGITLVQLREKHAAAREFVELARALKAILRPAGVPLLINDRIDVALAAEADGIHVGQSDMPYGLARRLMGPQAVIGLSVETMDQVHEAEKTDVDYLAASPIFVSGTKTDTGEPWGLKGLSEVRAATTKPLVGIGAIGPENATSVVRAGADGVAVVSAICAAESPKDAARNLLRVVTDAR